MITAATFECILPEYGQQWDRDARLVEAVTHGQAAEMAAERFCNEGAEWPPMLVVHVRCTQYSTIVRFEVAVETVPVYAARQIKDELRP